MIDLQTLRAESHARVGSNNNKAELIERNKTKGNKRGNATGRERRRKRNGQEVERKHQGKKYKASASWRNFIGKSIDE